MADFEISQGFTIFGSMKRFACFPIIATVLLAAACGIARRPSQAEIDLVHQTLDERSYTIDMDYMIPRRGSGKSVSTYYIKVSADSLDSYLPYFGQARHIPYGGGKGLNFQEKIDTYSDTGATSERRTVIITVTNDEDRYVYTLTLFDNGSADLHVHCNNRDDISYRGTLRLPTP